jgi:multicomponent Na+:H+ antiporter subunit B
MSLEREPGMSMIVRTVTRWLKGPILLFGIYIVLYGHITPGGGFGGGVIIASAFILIMLALGARNGLGTFSKRVASRLDSVGLLIFLLIGWLGTWFGAGLFYESFISTPPGDYFSLVSGGTQPLMNVALGLKVASALFLVFAVLTGIRIVGVDQVGGGLSVGAGHAGDSPGITDKQSPARPAPTGPSPARPAPTGPSPARPAPTGEEP